MPPPAATPFPKPPSTRATKNGHFVYDGWVKDGSMTMTYSGSNRREEVGKGEIRLFGRNASGEFLKATLRK